MILRKLKLQNIRSYLDEEIEFPDGTILLSGDIGCGKSTTLLAIEFALFGLRRDLSGSSLLRNGQDKGSVELTFLLDGKEVVIKRNLKRGSSVTQDSGYMLIDNKRKDLTALELKQEVLNILNYPQELLTKSKSLIYRYTVYTPQEEMKQILLGDKESRLDTLRKVFGIDKYKRINENASIFLSNLKHKIKELMVHTFDLEQKRSDFQKNKNELNVVEKNLSLIMPKLVLAKSDLEIKLKNLSQIEKDIESFHILNKEIDLLNLNLQHKTGDFDLNKKKLENLNSSVFDLEKELTGKILDDKTINLEIYEKDILQNESELRNIRDVMQELKTINIGCENIIKQINSLSNCPTCKQQVNDSHKHLVIKEENSKMEANKIRLNDLTLKNQEYESKLNSLKISLNSLRDKANQKLLLTHKLNLLNEKKNEINNLGTINSQLINDSLSINIKLKELSINKNSFFDLEKRFLLLKEDAEKLRIIEKSIEIEKVTLENEIKSKKELTLIVENEIKKKEDILKNVSYLRQLQTWIDDLFMNVVNVIEKKIMMKVHADFDGLFQNWFQILVDTEMIKVRLDEEFTPLIIQNGYEIEYESLSGGEKTAAALAYRLALNQVINNLVSSIKTKDILILDEPTDGFSSEQLDRLRLVLEELKIKQVVIVSHESKIESFVENVIKIEKRDHISKVISQ